MSNIKSIPNIMKLNLIMLCLVIFTVACKPDNAAKLEKLKGKQEKLAEEIKKLEKEVAKEDTSKKEEDAILEVKIEPVTIEDFKHTVEVQGMVKSDQNITLAAENGGRVIKVYVKAGDKVKKGQRLLDLDAGLIQSSLDELDTRLQLAEDTYKRQQKLWNQKIGTEMQFLQAKNNYEALKKQKQTLLTQKSKFNLIAPIDGTVDEIFVREGEVTAPGMQAVRVVNLNEVEVKAEVSERYIGKLKANDMVTIVFPALQDTIRARISSVGQVINPANRTFSLIIRMNNKENKLKPNLLAMIHITDYSKTNVPVVPGYLVQSFGNEMFIMTAKEANGKWKVHRTSVETGPNNKGKVLIESGLTAEDHIIIAGHLNVEEGDVVKPINVKP